MDLVRLNHNTTLPEELIEGYSSLRWTERYVEMGDFEIVSSNVEEVMAQLPLDSFVAILESDEVMWVESHLIEKDENGIAILKVSGRSFEVVLDHRVAAHEMGDPTPASWKLNSLSGYDHAANVANTILGGQLSSRDVIYDEGGVFTYFTIFTDPGDLVEAENTWVTVKRGSLYDTVQDLLRPYSMGIKNRRPKISANNMTMRFYSGLDRTAESTLHDPVVFSALAGHFEDVSYLFSVKDYRNVAYIYSPLDSTTAAHIGAPTYLGFARRDLYVDASEITEAANSTEKFAMLKERGRMDLTKHPKQIIFEGKVRPDAPQRFGLDYNLGDLVTAQGEYGIRETMRVSEYVRTEDSNGEIQYPTLKKLGGDPE
jgi:hypothetical protein